MYQNTINKIHEVILAKSESVAESFILANLDLLQSNDHSVIMISTHDLYGPDKSELMFKFTKSTLALSMLYPRSRIIILTNDCDGSYFFHSRFKHYFGVFRTRRLSQMMDFVKTMNVTKIYYASVLLRLLPISFIVPSIHIYNSDIMYLSSYLDTQNIDLVISCNTEANIQNINSLGCTINNISAKHIVLTNELIKGLECPQITPQYYSLSGSIMGSIKDSNIAIGMGIGLLSQYSYIKISNRNNLFDYFKTCI